MTTIKKLLSKKKPKAGGFGKRKGNKFENKVYDDIRSKRVMVRKNKGSGNAEDNKGDLETSDLLIECKHYAKITDKQIAGWMQKIYEEALPLEKYPLLIAKANNTPAKVYYFNKDMEICFMSYDFWLNNALIPDIVKKDVPSYIG